MAQLHGLSENNAYKVQAWTVGQYRPLRTKQIQFDDQVSRSSFAKRRRACETHLDLWMDGFLYPCDPSSGKRPKFQSPAQLLEYVAEGENGLLGYCNRLENNSGGTSRVVQEEDIEIFMLQNRCQEMIRSWGQDTREMQGRISELESSIVLLQNCLNLTQSGHEELQANSTRQREILQAGLDCAEQKIVDIELLHSQELRSLKTRLLAAIAQLNRMKKKFEDLIQTPYGIKQQVKARRDLRKFATNGGHAKAMRRLARLVVTLVTTQNVNHRNLTEATRHRLYGTKQSWMENGPMFASILSHTKVESMMHLPSMSPVCIRIANHYLEKVSAKLGSYKILETCDQNGITQIGYLEVYKKVKGGLQATATGLRLGCLPNPHRVGQLCQELNSKFKDFVGEWTILESTYEAPSEVPITKGKSKSSTKKNSLQLTRYNNLFLDIEAIQ